MSLDYELGYLLGRESARTGESEQQVREKLMELLTPITEKSKVGRPRTKYFVEGMSKAAHLSASEREAIREAQRRRWREEARQKRERNRAERKRPTQSPGPGWVLSKAGNWISPKHVKAMRANIAKGRAAYLAKQRASKK